ncbi:DUF4258 domain-containing protein [Caballeronia glebae]|uniref:DUF4258 domain-containing protein n=1 Tax=Caballeronia glebae TaxID=1777143 RepID=UPI0038BB5924
MKRQKAYLPPFSPMLRNCAKGLFLKGLISLQRLAWLSHRYAHPDKDKATMHTDITRRDPRPLHLLTAHAALRMQQRGISTELLDLVLCYGRTLYERGLSFRVIGHKEVERYAREGVDLSRAEGVHVLVQADGAVITTYRNQKLRKIRPTRRRQATRH